VVLIGTDPATLPPSAASTQAALYGLVRSLAKELRAGATANLVLVGDAGADVGPAVQFLLSSRSAYVNAQTLIVDAVDAPADDPRRPLQGRVAVVTGAGQGIGEAIVEVLHRDGATVVAVDLPAAGEALTRVANRVQGIAVQADITGPQAGQRIRQQCERLGGLDILVHNAGITRDRLLVNLSEHDWAAVLDVNLAAPLRLNDELLADDGPIRDGGRVVCVSSLSGIAGNRGQTNYAASKAGLIGLVAAEAQRLAPRAITCNAVAPGFIETSMTARMPFMPRELGRRLNSLAQGGLPVDVAETIAFLARPSSAGITGQVLRVCGQSLLGA
jgi:3-oxoacyl-[acyl-carrier protein] reductase